MKRVRIGTLCLVIALLGLILALLAQQRRIRRLEERVAELPFHRLPAIPPNGRSPLDPDPIDAPTSTAAGTLAQEGLDKTAANVSVGIPANRPAPAGIAIPSRVLPTPSSPMVSHAKTASGHWMTKSTP